MRSSSNNYADERVEVPPTRIDHEKLVLTALPGGGPAVTTRLELGKRPSKRALTDSFMIYVTSHGHHAAKRADGDAPGQLEDHAGDVEAGNAAALSIRGWSGNSLAVKVVAEQPPSSTAPFKLAVHLNNTSGHDLAELPHVELGTFVNDGGYLDTDADAFTIDQLDDESDLRTARLRGPSDRRLEHRSPQRLARLPGQRARTRLDRYRPAADRSNPSSSPIPIFDARTCLRLVVAARRQHAGRSHPLVFPGQHEPAHPGLAPPLRPAYRGRLAILAR